MLRPEAVQDLREAILVGQMREARVQEAGLPSRQHFLLDHPPIKKIIFFCAVKRQSITAILRDPNESFGQHEF